ncbi:iron uptake system protein EfeO [Microbacterium sp. X-17]|uniref:iron uptake system protein EfeO n=1 Tax=Microbacterium sp. X-17 TaxID=3144404 RepID=UPI0031F58B6F
MPSVRPLAIVAAVALATVGLAGCVANTSSNGAIKVSVTDTACDVATSTAPSGAVAFTLTNTGSDVNEFEIFALDKLRIVGEKENITPGTTTDYVVQLQPGTYYTACKFQQVGNPIGVAAFTVTGDAVAAPADQQAQIDQAVTNYISYVKSQTEQLVPATKQLVAAYEAGDDATARKLFPSVRAYYERIEPTAEQFGDLDPKIDFREVDAAADGLAWTGFHRIEKDLWPPAAGTLNSDGTDALAGWTPSTPAQRTQFGDQLVTDVQQLNDLVHSADFALTIDQISNGAISLLDEVAKNKITGEEDWWSHTDLADFAANVQGAEVAYENVRDLAAAQGDAGSQLVTEINAQFAALDALLAKYGSADAGYTPYDQVTDAQRKELSDQVNALAEPLSQLTHTVLGVSAG